MTQNGTAGGSGSNGDIGGASASCGTGTSARTAASSGWQSSLLTSRSAAALAARTRWRNSVVTNKDEDGLSKVAVLGDCGEPGESVSPNESALAAAGPVEALAAVAPGSPIKLPSPGPDQPAGPAASPAAGRTPPSDAGLSQGASMRLASTPTRLF
jgi:hypothetical protein